MSLGVALQRAAANSSGAGAAFDPLSLSPWTWLKADAITGKVDGDALSSWTDSTTNARNATQATGGNQPVYKTGIVNTKPVVRFTAGSSKYLALPDASALTAGTMVLVLAVGADPGTAASNGCWFMGTDAGSRAYYSFSDGNVYDQFGSTARKSTGNPTVALTGWHVYTARSTAGAWTSWINGTQHFTTATNTAAFTSTPLIGRNGAASGEYLTGDIAEFFLFPTALATSDRQAVERYLGTKYAITVA